MDASVVSPWFGIFGGVVTATTVVWKGKSWFQNQFESARVGAELGGKLAAELLNNATNPARRADIHAYIQFYSAKMEADYTRSNGQIMCTAICMLIAGIFMTMVGKLFNVDSLPWLWYIAIVSYVCGLLAFAMVIFHSRQLRHLQLGWLEQAENALFQRVIHHFSEP